VYYYNMHKIGVIGGSGLYDIHGVRFTKEETVETPYGTPSDKFRVGELDGKEIIFLPRHGAGHALAPHKINYRANIWGLRSLGVQRIFAVNATGAISEDMVPGDIVLPDQIIDFTMGTRPSTFYESGDVVHVDFTRPYCPELRSVLKEAAEKAKVPVIEKGTYIAVNGPRLETAAEIKFFAQIGGHILGMTGMPEASLAREIEMCFSVVAIATNYAAGVKEEKKLTTTEVLEVMARSTKKVKGILKEAFHLVREGRRCPCGEALKDSRL
jgi:5'-methylthioadenosine phosphorylase